MAKRTVSIILDDVRDSYKFEGMWTGKDVRAVIAHFPKQYRLYVRSIRRKEDDTAKVSNLANKDIISTGTAWGHPIVSKTGGK